MSSTGNVTMVAAAFRPPQSIWVYEMKEKTATGKGRRIKTKQKCVTLNQALIVNPLAGMRPELREDSAELGHRCCSRSASIASAS